MKEYIKPETELIKTEIEAILDTSVTHDEDEDIDVGEAKRHDPSVDNDPWEMEFSGTMDNGNAPRNYNPWSAWEDV